MAKIIATQEGSNPAAPASGKRLMFPKSDGWYEKDSAGAVVGPLVSNAVAKTYFDTLYQAINTTIPNNGWIAGTGTWSYSSADAPTFVASIPDANAALMGVGDKLKLTQTTDKYFIVMAKGSPSGGFTPVTINGGTDYTLANAAIATPFYSHVKSPLGFPMSHAKWDVSVENTTTYTKTSPTATTWYNAMDSGSLPSITLPIGEWDLFYEAAIYASRASATTTNMYITLSNATGTESDKLWTAFVGIGGASGTLVPQLEAHKRNLVAVAAKTPMYLNIKTQAGADTINVAGATITTKIKAICAYL